MQIILNEDESKVHLDQKIREAVLAETSKLPDGRKLRPKQLTTEQKSEIQRLHDTGMGRAQIAKELHLPGRQVSGVVQAYINAAKKFMDVDQMDAIAAAHIIPVPVTPATPKIEGLQPIKPLVMSEAKSAAVEPTCGSCGKSLGHDKVAIGGKFYCKPCAPKKVSIMVTKKPKPPRSNSEIDEFIITKSMGEHGSIDIANEINRQFGGAWMGTDVEKRLAELRKA